MHVFCDELKKAFLIVRNDGLSALVKCSLFLMNVMLTFPFITPTPPVENKMNESENVNQRYE